MKAMILAAGLGKRLKEYTKDKPKPMIDINGQPLLDINMKWLKANGITRVIANLYYLPKVIMLHALRSKLYKRFAYNVETELSGSAGGLYQCADFFIGEDYFLVTSGDLLTDIDIRDFAKQHVILNHKYGVLATMAIKEVDISETDQYGVVCDDEDNLVVRFQEKPKPEEALSNWINLGIYIFDKRIFKYIKQNQFQDFAKDVFPRLLEAGLIGTYHVKDAYWNDIGTPEKYQRALNDVKEGKINLW